MSKLQEKFWNKDKSKRRSVDHPVIEYVFSNKAQKLRKLICQEQVESILDCGCGNGFFQTYLSKAFNINCVGIDLSKEMIRINPNTMTYIGSVTELQFDDNSFDIVTCNALLHHLSYEEQIKALNEMSRVASKYVFISEPNRNNFLMALFSLIRQEERGALVFTKKYLEGMCGNINNINVVKSYIDSFVLPNKTPLRLLPFMKKLDTMWFSWCCGFCVNILLKVNKMNSMGEAM